ncbi:molybdate transporter ATP-binding protein [Actinobacillus equuli]|nr:molybdate transporter ATP-binding protein [Actinobacillus equuli]
MLQLNLHQTLGQLELAVKLDIPNKGVTAILDVPVQVNRV